MPFFATRRMRTLKHWLKTISRILLRKDSATCTLMMHAVPKVS